MTTNTTTEVIYIPVDKIASFDRFANKMAKKIKGFSYLINMEPKMQIYLHPARDSYGTPFFEKVFHEVYEVTITRPVFEEWKLICTFVKNGFFPSSNKNEIIFKNKNHGPNYHICDICGHSMHNSYVVENVFTGEELQIGCECVTKLGIIGLDSLSKFDRELYQTYDYYGSDSTSGLPIYRGTQDYSDFSAIPKSKVIIACKQMIQECPIYKKGYKDQSGIYHKSETLEMLKKRLQEDIIVDENYVETVCKYMLTQDITNDFSESMAQIASDHYVYSKQFVYVFFMVKKYEESLTKMQPEVKIGDAVKVEGELLHQYVATSIYGAFLNNTIKTSNGTICKKAGNVPINEVDGKKYVNFYSIVKQKVNNGFILKGATQRPKKNVNYITL